MVAHWNIPTSSYRICLISKIHLFRRILIQRQIKRYIVLYYKLSSKTWLGQLRIRHTVKKWSLKHIAYAWNLSFKLNSDWWQFRKQKIKPREPFKILNRFGSKAPPFFIQIKLVVGFEFRMHVWWILLSFFGFLVFFINRLFLSLSCHF